MSDEQVAMVCEGGCGLQLRPAEFCRVCSAFAATLIGWLRIEIWSLYTLCPLYGQASSKRLSPLANSDPLATYGAPTRGYGLPLRGDASQLFRGLGWSQCCHRDTPR